jgi:hypothetical protein
MLGFRALETDEVEKGEEGEKKKSREIEFSNPLADSEEEGEDESGDDKKGTVRRGRKGSSRGWRLLQCSPAAQLRRARQAS